MSPDILLDLRIFSKTTRMAWFYKFKNKINIIDAGASDGIAARFFNKKLN